MTDANLEILLEDGPCLMVNKPGGVLTQAPPGIDSMEVRIKRFLKTRDEKTGNIYLAVPHRLDRPVSGAMVFAKHVRAARRIAEQFEGRLVEKTYWAWVEGVVEPDAGAWQDYMRKVPGEARAKIADKTDDGARNAELDYRVLKRFSGSTLLEIQLQTGRTHQIRVQSSSRGFPVIGDQMYGSTVQFGPQTNDQRQRCIALHARSLSLRHPMTREKITTVAPLPDPWNDCDYRQYSG